MEKSREILMFFSRKNLLSKYQSSTHLLNSDRNLALLSPVL